MRGTVAQSVASLIANFDPSPVQYFRGDYQGGFSTLVKYVQEELVNRLVKPHQEKVWLG